MEMNIRQFIDYFHAPIKCTMPIKFSLDSRNILTA